MTRSRRRLASVLCLTVLAACGSSPGDAPDGGTGPHADAPPETRQDFAGSYAYTGTWDLSEPFGGDGIGGFVAELMIGEIIALAGVPSALEGEAHDALADQVRQPIVEYVNGVVPPELAPDGPVMTALDAMFAEVDVVGTLSLVEPSVTHDFTGTDTVTGLTVTHEAATIPVPMEELLGGVASVAGPIQGRRAGGAGITIDEYPLEIRYGQLVIIVAREALGVDLEALSETATAALDCAALVDAVTGGGDTLSISVGGSSFSVSASSIEGACATLKTEMTGQVLGMIRPDAGITLGGPASLGDLDADLVTDRITSGAGYGGSITGMPLPVEPAVIASFTATR